MTKTRSPAENFTSAKRMATAIKVILVAALGGLGYMALKRHHHEISVPPAEGVLFSEIQRENYFAATRSQTADQDDTASLEKLLEQLKNPQTIPPDIAKKAVQDSIVQIMKYEKQFCSGLLLTYDGWIATAAHCLPPYVTSFSHGVRYQGRDYPIVSEFPDYERDIMLIKADMDVKMEPVSVHFVSGEPQNSQRVAILGYHLGKLFEKEGRITEAGIGGIASEPWLVEYTHNLTGVFVITAKVEQGMSGSIAVDEATGRFAGIVIAKRNNPHKKDDRYATVAPAANVTELVQTAVRR